MRVLHLSDIHLTQDYRGLPLWRMGPRWWKAGYELSFKGRARAYAKAGETVRALLAHGQRQGAVHGVVSGDLTSSATDLEFRLAYEALEEWARAGKLSVIPGNHDCHHPAALSEKRFERYFQAQLHTEFPEHRRVGSYPYVQRVGDEVAVVGMNSALLPSLPGVAYGRLGKQLEGLAQIVKDPRLASRALLVAVHHAPRREDGRPDRRVHALLDADALLALLPGPRFAVLHGHIHQRYHHEATAKAPHLFNAGSSTQAGREGGWLIDVEAGRVVGGVPVNVPVGG